MAEFISEDKQKFLESSIDDDFGISIDEVAENVKNYARFNSLLGGNVSNIKKVLNIVKDAGMSPTFFGAYEINEGYTSQFGWLNRTYYTGDPYNDARSVAETMVNISNDTSTFPSWTDTGTNNLDFVPSDVKEKGNKHFNDLPKGTIGRAYIPSTAAATWDAYYPNGLKAEYNGIQDYGGAITDAFETIKSWGGTIGGNNNDDNSDNGNSGNDGNGTDIGDIFQDLTEEGLKVAKQMLKKIEDAFQWDIHSIGTDKYFSNDYFQIMKTYNNTYKIKWRPDFLKMFGNLFDDITDNDGNDDNDGSNGDNGGNDDGGNNGDSDTKYDTCDLKNHKLNFRYGLTVEETQANGYPFSDKAHHGNDYNYINEELKSHVSGTVDGNNGHGGTVGDGGIGYDGDGSGWGNRIVIKLDDGSGRSILYGHLNRMDVKAGDKVKVGQVIGQTGNTGEMTTGAHLHVELVDPKNTQASDRTIDPTPFIDKHCNS